MADISTITVNETTYNLKDTEARTQITTHTHGNISNVGAITSDTAVANGDKIIVADSSNSSKLIRTGISFDGSTATKALTQKGTWESFASASHEHSAADITSGTLSATRGGTGQTTLNDAGNAIINALGEGTSAAQRDDYIVAQYAGGGTTTKTYHRRKLSNIFKALNSSDVTTALGFTPSANDHTHGNISNTGAITSDTAVANGDKIVVTDSSASSKLIRTGISFDGSTTTKALTPKGTWETFTKASDLGTMASIDDAPSDSKEYARKNGTWTEVSDSSYTLPIASSSTLGGIKVGTNLSINSSSGVLSSTDTKYTAVTTSIGSASAGTAIPADDITAWSTGTLGDGIYDTTTETLTLIFGTLPSLSYTAKNIPNITVTNKTVMTGITAN